MWYELTENNDIIPISSSISDISNIEKIESSKHRRNLNYIEVYNGNFLVLKLRISTVFLSLDHSLGIINGELSPILFETMVFVDEDNSLNIETINFVKEINEKQLRYYTLRGARLGHKNIVLDLINRIKDIGCGYTITNIEENNKL